MRYLPSLLLAATASLLSCVGAAPLQVHPGGVEDLQITANNTVNGTQVASGAPVPEDGALNLALVNNLSGGTVNCYVTGSDSNGNLVMLQPNGQFYYPTASGSVPAPINADVAITLGGQGSTTNIAIPSYIQAARIWFAEGNLQFFTVENANGTPGLVEPSAVNPQDPSANVNWGFVELTNTAVLPNGTGGLYADISYVDFVGIPLGMTLTDTSGNKQSALGLTSNAVSSICNDLSAQTAADGYPWSDLCITSSSGSPLRVLNPNDYLSINPNAFANYFTSYIQQVYSYYSTNTLTINTQAGPGDVSCTVSGGVIQCPGDDKTYAQPAAEDIFGCNSGPFVVANSDTETHKAVVPRLCAAFNRGTFFVSGGNVQPGPPSSEYYTTSPCNHFSRIVHKYEVDAKGYAFSYDDVSPNPDDNASGTLVSTIPSLLEITVGGPSS